MAEWNHALGFTYLGGFNDVTDTIEDNLEARGFDVDSFNIPVGIAYSGYQEWDSGFGLGISVGPAMAGFGDIEFFNIPLGVDGRYTFQSSGANRPYLRLGVRNNFASGDYIEGGDIGPFGAIGIEFREKGSSGWGIELAYDGSELEIEDRSSQTGMTAVKPAEFMLSVFFLF